MIGILFGAAGSYIYTWAILAFSAITLFYSMLGGLSASLRTDVFQMVIFLGTLVLLIALVAFGLNVQLADLAFKPFVFDQPGPVLMLVALLQIWSYPMHDPVMMDRGFLANRETTRKSFLHAAWISILCILAFGCLGVLAGAHAVKGASMNDTLMLLLGTLPMLLFNAALVISAMSTLDSTLSSSAKLLAVDMGVMKMSLRNGRAVMAAFMLLGLALVFWGNKDLFSAVAVSGTASLYLAPVIFFSLWGKRADIPLWSYLFSFVLAITAAVLYFTESSGYSQLLGAAHKYTKLLYLSVAVLGFGCFGFWFGGKTAKPQETLELIHDWGISVVQGNCEESFGAAVQDCGCGFEEGTACSLLSDKWYRYASQQITACDRLWMQQLPKSLSFSLAGHRMCEANLSAACRISDWRCRVRPRAALFMAASPACSQGCPWVQSCITTCADSMP